MLEFDDRYDIQQLSHTDLDDDWHGSSIFVVLRTATTDDNYWSRSQDNGMMLRRPLWDVRLV